MEMFNTQKADTFFQTITPELVKKYETYWDSVKPKTTDDFFRRYLFAITSVHTTWQGNIRGYEAIKDLSWLDDKEELRKLLIKAKCGMFNVRTDIIWQFKEQFYSNVEYYCSIPEDWQKHRNELVKQIKGIGMAKVSFTLEMCFPNEAEITCIDTHGIQLYEIPVIAFGTKKEVAIYQDVENHWFESAKNANCSPYIARCIYWDMKQQKDDSRYWSYVLEN